MQKLGVCFRRQASEEWDAQRFLGMQLSKRHQDQKIWLQQGRGAKSYGPSFQGHNKTNNCIQHKTKVLQNKCGHLNLSVSPAALIHFQCTLITLKEEGAQIGILLRPQFQLLATLECGGSFTWVPLDPKQLCLWSILLPSPLTGSAFILFHARHFPE